ncbi:glycoside hydrolase family 47 protein [Sclerotinia borealis F-4128]|uniref:alpha-1,2-Mannosidase n=1 Tax=Sclerotinia borealis (strain F-4128) TaxID=1432307 RepID=W9CGB9_SCLBF|nr:glycoside hydrolase family 47 protein [Sclerotinia borealis F-4128]
MLRIRRYRALLIFAVFITAILIRFTHIRDWESYTVGSPVDIPDSKYASEKDKPYTNGPIGVQPTAPETLKEESEVVLKPAKEETTSIVKAAGKTSTTTSDTSTTSNVIAIQTVDTTLPKYTLPDRKPPIQGDYDDSGFEDLHPIAPDGRQDLPIFSAAPTTIHWSKQAEHFPVPTESIINLPTGVPISIPKIQYVFKDETTDAKISREKRQNKVKEEFLKSWSGYKKYAWGHDELSPVSSKFRDPFCGWAATLVDGLDTLWIMGLFDEFEEAVRVVENIDFTTTPRMDIPVFETTIRYLGGLLAAFDVSGGKFQVLLDKATELAEILMGAFDTPNRMPILHYQWKPTFASQAHRASPRANLAELGSLSMEFTRLAQLTGEQRYYDAVARVTNALSEWQDRDSTKVPGVFPEDVDAAGCNRTATLLQQKAKKEAAMAKETALGNPQTAALLEESPEGYKPPSPESVKELKPKKIPSKGGNMLEMQVLPGEPGKARIQGWEEGKAKKRELTESTELAGSTKVSSSPPPVAPAVHHLTVSKTGSGLSHKVPPELTTVGSVNEWDCVKQGLESYNQNGRQKFSMGGGQDSTYEYFPKQYMLLGGLEEVYRKMYMKTIVSIREHMLFRPMIPGEDDILISGKVTSNGIQDENLLIPEITHLTCFIGGMVGMSAKIFGIEGDLEIAKKLTDGCVWAYGATPSGIMPEGSEVIACQDAENCAWNQTLYYEYLDPSAAYRDSNLKDYIENKEKLDAEVKDMDLNPTDAAREQNALAKAEAVAEPQGYVGQKEIVTGLSSKAKTGDTHLVSGSGSSSGDATSSDSGSPKKDLLETRSDAVAFKPKEKPALLTKRQISAAGTLDGPEKESMLKQKSANTEAELESLTGGRQLEKSTSSQKSLPAETLPDPLRPLSHKEYVEARIKQESLPLGFTSIHARKYILRPEAIESVWYMYRITGDKSWQDKGWKMFEAVIKATSSKYGHSAIYDVTSEQSYQVDEMESFWLAETLKYFYLLFSTPETISLDDWVLNTEAHPFKRPTA